MSCSDGRDILRSGTVEHAPGTEGLTAQRLQPLPQVASKSTAGTLSNASKEASPNASTNALAALDLHGTNGAEEISDRTVTGVLTSHPQSRDVHIESVTLLFHGHQLLEDTAIELNHGRWGLKRLQPLPLCRPCEPKACCMTEMLFMQAVRLAGSQRLRQILPAEGHQRA